VIEVVSKQTPESTGGVLVLPLVVVAVVLLGASKGMQLSHLFDIRELLSQSIYYIRRDSPDFFQFLLMS
jgi:hypothetical protein